MNTYAGTPRIEGVKTKFTFDYTLHDGSLKGNTYPAGQAWEGEKDRDKAAEELSELLAKYGCRVSISYRRKGQICLN